MVDTVGTLVTARRSDREAVACQLPTTELGASGAPVPVEMAISGSNTTQEGGPKEHLRDNSKWKF